MNSGAGREGTPTGGRPIRIAVIGKEDTLLVIKQFGADKFAVVLQRAITPATGGQEHKHPNCKEMFYHRNTLHPNGPSGRNNGNKGIMVN
jgi:hypothetical protein